MPGTHAARAAYVKTGEKFNSDDDDDDDNYTTTVMPVLTKKVVNKVPTKRKKIKLVGSKRPKKIKCRNCIFFGNWPETEELRISYSKQLSHIVETYRSKENFGKCRRDPDTVEKHVDEFCGGFFDNWKDWLVTKAGEVDYA